MARRLAAMPNDRPHRGRLALLLPAVVLTLAACAGAAASTSPTNPPAGTPQPTPTAVPGDPGSGTGGGSGGSGGGPIVDPGSGGGSDGNTGSGIGGLFPPDPDQNPLFGQATYLTPGTDLQNQHPVNVQLVRALQRDDGTVIADLRWWSGVAPCSQLDHVEIARDDAARTISFTVIEGAGKGEVACIDIAQLSATTVELGTLAAGAWKVSAEGDAPTITLEVK